MTWRLPQVYATLADEGRYHCSERTMRRGRAAAAKSASAATSALIRATPRPSCYIVGWMVAPKESAPLAERLIVEACARRRIAPGQLTPVHAETRQLDALQARRAAARGSLHHRRALAVTRIERGPQGHPALLGCATSDSVPLVVCREI